MGLYWNSSGFQISQMSHIPNAQAGEMMVLSYIYSTYGVQYAYCYQGGNLLGCYVRYCTWGSVWGDWNLVNTGTPTFYNSYSDLASLASALGEPLGVSKISVELTSNDTYTVETSPGLAFIGSIYFGYDIYRVGYNVVTLLSSPAVYANFLDISMDGYNIVVRNKTNDNFALRMEIFNAY